MSRRRSGIRGGGLNWLRSLSLAIIAAFAVTVVGATAEAATSAAIVVDAKTGKVLYSSNADARCYPASLTKMMTLYMLFEALDSGKVTLSSRIPISKHAAAQPPSKLGLKPGQTIAVKDAILSLVTRSANDIAAAIGEFLGGTESGFAVKMTAKARAIGMKGTTFKNASGLPDPGQVTTARDMALLGRALQDRFPKYYAYFKTPSFTYGGRKIANHNRLLGRVDGVDGIKTGYTKASGFNLVTSVNRDGRSVVAVVLGGKSGSSRDQRMAGLLADYVPKASTGTRTAAVIAPATTALAFASAVPTPRAKPDADTSVQTGSVAVADIVEDDATAQGDVADDAGDDSAQRSPDFDAASRSGWKIQIAATPSVGSAIALLDSARAKAPGVLAKASPYTEPVVKGSTTLYRARFAGFAGKEQARAACAYLAKRDFSCLAISE